MKEDRIFEGLNPEQAAGVSALRGPVCILAGAGSGKTTTITRRIAHQVVSGAFGADRILAVTFTDKAAKEMATRLERLGVAGVRARTFHAEALAQYKRYSGDESEILSSKAQVIASLVSALPRPYRFVALRDVATEIERAKNRRVQPPGYQESLGGHEPPMPPDLMAGIYGAYERRKARARLIDFEDVLERTIELLASDARALAEVRDRYRSFTVDEYQDVNLLQQTLLEAWAGDRRELCVVGDDYQSIFGFTGASARYLLEFPRRHPDCRVVRLTTNYRSTPQILEIANRLVPGLRGTHKMLGPALPPGPNPALRVFASGDEEAAWIVRTAGELHAGGTPWEEMAVLFRINGRSEGLEETFSSAGIPYQVRDSPFLRRPAARSVLARLRRGPGGDLAETVDGIVQGLGYRPDADVQGDEATRQADLGRLLKLAQEYEGRGGVDGFVEDLRSRFAGDETGRGVQLLTFHRAKGQEFEVVFLPRLEERELPFALARSDEDLAEERRLLYVGITRAKRHLYLSYATLREGERRRFPRPSPFLDELQRAGTFGPTRPGAPSGRSPAAAAGNRHDPRRSGVDIPERDGALFDALKAWRLKRSRDDDVPAFVVFSDRTLAAIASSRPRDFASLLEVSGIGAAKSALYGVEVLEVVAKHC